jgi:hypothetical protein
MLLVLRLMSLRERCQSNPPPSLGYYEYSAPPFCALDDRKAWAAANPALGILITEETLAGSAYGADHRAI